MKINDTRTAASARLYAGGIGFDRGPFPDLAAGDVVELTGCEVGRPYLLCLESRSNPVHHCTGARAISSFA